MYYCQIDPFPAVMAHSDVLVVVFERLAMLLKEPMLPPPFDIVYPSTCGCASSSFVGRTFLPLCFGITNPICPIVSLCPTLRLHQIH